MLRRGLDELVTVSGGVVWYYGVGGSRTFTFSETAYFSPNDFGDPNDDQEGH